MLAERRRTEGRGLTVEGAREVEMDPPAVGRVTESDGAAEEL